MFLGCVLRMKQTLVDAVAREGYSAVMRRIPLVTHFHGSERWHRCVPRFWNCCSAFFAVGAFVYFFHPTRGDLGLRSLLFLGVDVVTTHT